MELVICPEYREMAKDYANINPPPVLIPLNPTVNKNHGTTFDDIQSNHSPVCSVVTGTSTLCKWSNCLAHDSISGKHTFSTTTSMFSQPYLEDQNEFVDEPMLDNLQKIQVEKLKSASTNVQIFPQTFQCFNDECQCFFSVQSQITFPSKSVSCDMSEINNGSLSIRSNTPVVSTRRPMAFISQSTENYGSQTHIPVVNVASKSIEKTIEDALRTIKPSKKSGSIRKQFYENRRNISEHQRRNTQKYYLGNVNSFPTKCDLNLFMTLNKLAKVMRVNEYN